MTMPDEHTAEAGAKAVKLVASDWRKLTLLAVGIVVLSITICYRVVATTIEAKIDQVDANAQTLSEHDRRIVTLEQDARASTRATEAVAGQIAETNRELKAATAEMNRLRGTLEAMQIYGR